MSSGFEIECSIRDRLQKGADGRARELNKKQANHPNPSLDVSVDFSLYPTEQKSVSAADKGAPWQTVSGMLNEIAARQGAVNGPKDREDVGERKQRRSCRNPLPYQPSWQETLVYSKRSFCRIPKTQLQFYRKLALTFETNWADVVPFMYHSQSAFLTGEVLDLTERCAHCSVCCWFQERLLSYFVPPFQMEAVESNERLESRVLSPRIENAQVGNRIRERSRSVGDILRDQHATLVPGSDPTSPAPSSTTIRFVRVKGGRAGEGTCMHEYGGRDTNPFSSKPSHEVVTEQRRPPAPSKQQVAHRTMTSSPAQTDSNSKRPPSGEEADQALKIASAAPLAPLMPLPFQSSFNYNEHDSLTPRHHRRIRVYLMMGGKDMLALDWLPFISRYLHHCIKEVVTESEFQPVSSKISETHPSHQNTSLPSKRSTWATKQTARPSLKVVSSSDGRGPLRTATVRPCVNHAQDPPTTENIINILHRGSSHHEKISETSGGRRTQRSQSMVDEIRCEGLPFHHLEESPDSPNSRNSHNVALSPPAVPTLAASLRHSDAHPPLWRIQQHSAPSPDLTHSSSAHCDRLDLGYTPAPDMRLELEDDLLGEEPLVVDDPTPRVGCVAKRVDLGLQRGEGLRKGRAAFGESGRIPAKSNTPSEAKGGGLLLGKPPRTTSNSLSPTSSGKHTTWVRTFCEFDAAFVLVEYPGYGYSDGEPTAEGVVDSAVQVLRRVLAHVPSKSVEVQVVGYSLGAAVALKVSTLIALHMVACQDSKQRSPQMMRSQGSHQRHKWGTTTTRAPRSINLEAGGGHLPNPSGGHLPNPSGGHLPNGMKDRIRHRRTFSCAPTFAPTSQPSSSPTLPSTTFPSASAETSSPPLYETSSSSSALETALPNRCDHTGHLTHTHTTDVKMHSHLSRHCYHSHKAPQSCTVDDHNATQNPNKLTMHASFMAPASSRVDFCTPLDSENNMGFSSVAKQRAGDAMTDEQVACENVWRHFANSPKSYTLDGVSSSSKSPRSSVSSSASFLNSVSPFDENNGYENQSIISVKALTAGLASPLPEANDQQTYEIPPPGDEERPQLQIQLFGVDRTPKGAMPSNNHQRLPTDATLLDPPHQSEVSPQNSGSKGIAPKPLSTECTTAPITDRQSACFSAALTSSVKAVGGYQSPVPRAPIEALQRRRPSDFVASPSTCATPPSNESNDEQPGAPSAPPSRDSTSCNRNEIGEDDPLDKINSLAGVLLLAPFTSVSDCAASFLKLPSHSLTCLTGSLLSGLMHSNVRWDNTVAVKEMYQAIERKPSLFRGMKLVVLHGNNDSMIPSWMGRKVVATAKQCISSMSTGLLASPTNTPTEDDWITAGPTLEAEFILLEGGNHRNITMGAPFQHVVFNALRYFPRCKKLIQLKEQESADVQDKGEAKLASCCGRPARVRRENELIRLTELDLT
eukprot:GHVN01057704.1.p1 GENE.GHVN01057704.1~~GHVN01057704.1.p1  ORF type:complete len:1430 (+),score=199.25 GHVN01057704.1:108-4397(+)